MRTLALPPNLIDAVAYASLGGGKRMRPLLAWHAAEAAGAPGQHSLPAAAAVEFVHAFSLVHDDLPALDNDDLRRGRPTLHLHAGEAMAILAGDALMAIAFDVLARQAAEPGLAGLLVGELSAATTGMISGQVYDTLGGFPPGLGDGERLELIHRNKTGALIRGSCRMGAILGIAGRLGGGGAAAITADPRLGAITRYGECVGLMFQIVDDLLDVESSPEQTGKRTGKDMSAGKLTYPAVLGVAGSRAEVNRLLTEALASVAGLGRDAAGLQNLARMMAERRS